MKTSQLQALIAMNSVTIFTRAQEVASHIGWAKLYASAGQKESAVQEYKDADKERNKLAKAVALQHMMKTELAALHAEARIEAKKLRLFGATANQVSFLSTEVEASLDEMIAIKFPAKPDSRIPAA